jgi:hypothetical protein
MGSSAVTVDLKTTDARRRRLERYFDHEVTSFGQLICRHGGVCKSEACRVRADFYAGQLSYLGSHYDLLQTERPLRVLIVPMEVGAPPGFVSMTQRTEQVQAVRYGSRNPHMQGVVFALQLAFGIPLSAGRANEHVDTDDGQVHVLDAFAMANLRLCSLAAPGKKSRATELVSANCAAHLAQTIRILKPTLVISQGKDVRPTLARLFALERQHSDHVFTASLAADTFVWAAFYHPTRWWDRLGRPYLREVVEPELKRARRLALRR